MYSIEFPEYWCTIDELSESWAVKIDLIEESYVYVGESRDIDEGDEVL